MATLQRKKEGLLDISGISSSLYLLRAFLAMEPPDVLISFARDMGGGSVGENVQKFIWNNCICKTVRDRDFNGSYLRRFLKKLIAEIECTGDVAVLAELYGEYVFLLTSLKDEDLSKVNSRVIKRISFLFPDECFGLSSCPKTKELDMSLQCSLNMLEGDTGCSIWPSSLFLSEFILSYPEIFSNKFCFEVGSGVGLVGLCLAHVNASAVILSDGDLSTLANMKLNLESNLQQSGSDFHKGTTYPSGVKCICLPWESAAKNELQSYAPDIVLGADVIYDPLCLPHLVRLLSILLKGDETSAPSNHASSGEECKQQDEDTNHGCSSVTNWCERNVESYYSLPSSSSFMEVAIPTSKKGTVAYVASVIRNVETFNYFLELMKQVNLTVNDITEKVKPFNLLPYLKSYPRSTIRMFCISCEHINS